MRTPIVGGYSTEYRGLSTDSKPTNVENGAVFFEMDTSKVFMFDYDHQVWREL